MEQIINYVKPELVVLSVVLWILGNGFKQSEVIKDKYIPIINGILGIILSAIYVFATCSCTNAQEVAMAAFTAITQGVLVAGLSTYANQIIKQSNKLDE